MAERDRLEAAYPGVTVHYPQRDAEGQLASWAGAEQVFGRPMPASGPTGRGAAESVEGAVTDWLDTFAAVFQGDGLLEELDFEITAVMPLWDNRVAVRFEQRLYDPEYPENTIAPRGVHGRALASEGENGWTVNYVSFVPLDEPEGGTAAPVVTLEAALLIASTESDAGQSGTEYQWAEPQLVVMASETGPTPRLARAVWQVSGVARGEGFSIVQVMVDGATGAIRSERPITPAGFAQTPSVSGTVTAEVLQGLTPWVSTESLLSCSSFTTGIEALPKFRVELLDAPGGNVVLATRTNASGYYEFNNQPITSTSHVRFVPQHENFHLSEVTSFFEQVDPLLVYAFWDDLSGHEKPIGLTGATVNYHFADDRSTTTPGAELDIVDASVYMTIHETREFFKTRLQSNNNAYYLGLDDSNLRVFSTDSMIVDRPMYIGPAGYLWSGYAVPYEATPEFIGEQPCFSARKGTAFAAHLAVAQTPQISDSRQL